MLRHKSFVFPHPDALPGVDAVLQQVMLFRLLLPVLYFRSRYPEIAVKKQPEQRNHPFP